MSVKPWLQAVSQLAPRSQEAVYLELGHEFSREPLSEHQKDRLAILLRGIHDFRPGECYMNAGKIALEHDCLKFCEGLAAGLWPMAHSWVSFEGRAIDVTWPTAWKTRLIKSAKKIETVMQRIEHNLKNCTYYGVEIPTRVFRRHVLKEKCWSPLFAPEYYQEWPAFKELLTGKKFATLSERGN